MFKRPSLQTTRASNIPVFKRPGLLRAGCRDATAEYAARRGNVNQARPMQNRRTGVYSREQLTRLLHPKSIAVVGASTRAGSFGERVIFNMKHYAGASYPV